MPKIGIITSRAETSYSFMHGIYDFEECIVKATGAEVINVPPKKNDLVSKCKHKVHLDGIRLKDFYDVLFCVSSDFETSLDYILNWRARCKYCICYIFDSWPNISKYDLRYIKRTVQRVDLLCFSLFDSIPYFKTILNPLPHWVPQGINTDRFYYVPKLNRGIDVYLFGRQPEGIFTRIKSFCIDHNLLLAHHYKLPFPEGKVLDWQDGFTLHAQLLLHAKITLNWAMHVTHPWLKISPVTGRWLEASATGCLVVGCQPGDSQFQKIFPIPGFVRNVDNEFKNLTALIEETIQDTKTEELRRQLAEYTKSHHTWYHRIAQILRIAKLEQLLKPEYRKFLNP